MKTTLSLKPAEVTRGWTLIDAEGLVLGRLAAIIAQRLRGKHKPQFTPHVDCGDNIVVINAEKVRLTGNKVDQKLFHYHTGYPGGIKERTITQRLTGKNPGDVVRKAVERMITRGPLQRAQMKHLYVYAGSEHPHEGQKPQVLDVASMNRKNAVNTQKVGG
ncbi:MULTISPECIES: 50S ribosomal protein L13 [Komagataeibacter]|uniref:Large ribosomal subunit protein uL13 n=3 Tax=Komagataeibacter TaxID=1434011 RepID=A0A2V4RCM2_9PROT|nr:MULTISPECIES: 50S ribosomal protein L13 [Komagataeibacter]AHI26773.1 50S ribosomal protein L13 [Komagataeibacter xylinus E25]RFP00510.1 50S ribosomal protein L13 [Komagataeibacter xylinus]GBR28654.1 50S ribosomal protein L13 [Komagataeibacter oboediens DSM 11826]MBL7232259.1 50S ribosomal protein L13 [Komagataeibacter oboediens]MBT0676166.1 50S ribosomal protein L13 [Komagataeibacter oboediens]